MVFDDEQSHLHSAHFVQAQLSGFRARQQALQSQPARETPRCFRKLRHWPSHESGGFLRSARPDGKQIAGHAPPPGRFSSEREGFVDGNRHETTSASA